jgi:SAM-dependent methyltransferase
VSLCPICASRVDSPFVEIKGVPVHVSTLHRTPDGARTAPRGDLALAFCDGCGFIWNVAYDAALVAYDTDYENSLDHSPAFIDYVDGLAQRLVDRYDVRGKRVVEVGCGQADFLRRLSAAGGNQGFGYDPSYVGEEVDGAVTVRRELYNEATVGDADPDFLCCRHVLEHVEQPLAFIQSLRRTLDAERGTPVYFEVPNGEHQLANGVVWDMIYAHFATFTEASLRTLFELGGFEVIEAGTSFGGQYLWIEARPVAEPVVADRADEVTRLRAVADGFAAGYHGLIGDWNRRVETFASDGQRVVLWGAGAKGVSLLNALDVAAPIDSVVDLNPRKHGSFVPGSGTPVVAPETLVESSPDVVVLANPIYRDEVRGILADLGQDADVICV